MRRSRAVNYSMTEKSGACSYGGACRAAIRARHIPRVPYWAFNQRQVDCPSGAVLPVNVPEAPTISPAFFAGGYASAVTGLGALLVYRTIG